MPKTTVVLEHFNESETKGLKPRLCVMLQAMRYLTGLPIVITSGLRPGDRGAHGSGDGVDISDNGLGAPVASRWRQATLAAAYAVGFRRVGIYDRHIHVDIATTLPQDVSWWDTSD